VAKKIKVRATINQSGVRAGDVVEVDDDDNTAAKIAGGFFIPVDGRGNVKTTPDPAPAPAEASTASSSTDSKPTDK
jgi:hypothetical protein